ncbi:hypothetical protein K438DRAFT_1990901 [Mycena galopus ATCC 62051]|nr:hypothetical protein K438DRAFT_1990901 [Mycena galopus ATCC 62051]
MPSKTTRFAISSKNVYYVRPEVGSCWLGPPDDRMRVPALDWPEGVEPPPDPDVLVGGARTTRAPEDETRGMVYVSPHRAQQPYRPDYGAFGGGPTPPQFRGVVAPSHDAMAGASDSRRYGQFTGPFANTMAYRNRELGRRHEDARHCDHLDEGTRNRGATMGPVVACITARHWVDRTAHGSNNSAREQQLRKRALHSKASTGTKPGLQPTRPVPDVDAASRGVDGHPVPPLNATADDESDYGSSGAEEGSELLKFRTREHDRLAKVTSKMGNAPVSGPLPVVPSSAGLWEGLSFDSIPSARNLVWWWSHGCPKACAMGKFLMKVYGEEQLRRRSEGVQYILRHASTAHEGYLGAATGDSTPLSRRDPNTVSRQDRHRIKNQRLRRAQAGSEASGTITTESSLNFDEPMLEAPPTAAPPTNPVPVTPMAASYTGTSPIPPPADNSMTTHWLGPQMSLHDAMAHAAAERPINWVRGMRTAAGTWPTEETPVGRFPMASDLRAARLLHFLAPVQRDARHVQLGSWVAGSRMLEHYPFDAMNITYSQSMQWVHAHGVDRASTAAHELHAFATSWRNLHEGLPTTTGQRFSGHDIETTESVLRWDEGRITAWATLWHGPLRPGVVSSLRLEGDLPRSTEAPTIPAFELFVFSWEAMQDDLDLAHANIVAPIKPGLELANKYYSKMEDTDGNVDV